MDSKEDQQDTSSSTQAPSGEQAKRSDREDDTKQQQDKQGGEDGKKESKEEGKDESKDESAGKRPGKKPLIILGAVALVLIIGAIVYWFLTRNQVSTDDAFTDGDAVTMAAKVSGYVTQLDIEDNRRVKKGDVLLRIDERDYLAQRDQAAAQLGLAQAQLHQSETQLDLAKVQYPAQLAQAQAQLASAEANLQNANASYARQRGVDPRATSQANIDTASAQQRSARADVENARAQVRVAAQVPLQVRQAEATVEQRRQQVRQAAAQLEAAELNLSYTEVRAPSDGWVTKRNVQLGSFVQAGSSLFSLVTTDLWVTANFKEAQLTRMHLGDPVKIKIDAFPDLDLHGHVDSIQQGTGSRFSAFPAENATGNYVKIVQRVPVKIVIDRGLDASTRLPLGLSVEPTVELQ